MLAAEDHKALDHVAQLAYVAAPRHGRECLDGILVDGLGGDVVLVPDLPGKVSHQLGDVFPPLAQGRDTYDDDTQAVVEVLAEVAAGDLAAYVLVCGGDDAYVHREVLVAAHAADLVLLKRAQHLGLRRERHVAYLVHEERTAVGLFELALALSYGGCEGTLLVSEKLALDKLRWYGRAVHLDEGGAGAGALLVEPARHELLSRAVLARDQDTGIRRGDLVDKPPYVADGLRRTDYVFRLEGCALARGGLGGLGCRLLFVFYDAPQRPEKAVHVHGCGEVVFGPALDGRDGPVDGARRCHYYKGYAQRRDVVATFARHDGVIAAAGADALRHLVTVGDRCGETLELKSLAQRVSHTF